VLNKSGNSLEYVSPVSGEIIKKFRKAWNKDEDGCLSIIMNEWGSQPEEVLEEMGDVEMPMEADEES
jgi:hypothetical protein